MRSQIQGSRHTHHAITQTIITIILHAELFCNIDLKCSMENNLRILSCVTRSLPLEVDSFLGLVVLVGCLYIYDSSISNGERGSLRVQ